MNKRFKILRKSLKLTQENMAAKLGRCLAVVKGYEYGTHNITDGILLKLNELFNVNIDWMRSGKGQMFLTTELQNNSTIPHEFHIALPERFLELAYRLTKKELLKVEGYMESLLERRNTDE